ncbi:hypothetical protein ACSVHC_15145 [Arthrobacter sp. KNU-44]|uniref:hypothetical protein n=1 Tax=unclassified Arthrobacter TaxID=235627 RepID=UPI003F42FE31
MITSFKSIPRIAIFCSSLKNPFIEAWLKTWEASGAKVAVLANVHPSDSSDTPDYLHERTVYFDATDPGSMSQWKAELESKVGGQPSAIFYWWGLASLFEKAPAKAWPNAKVSLCVDTYPNASRLLTELREFARSAFPIAMVDSFVVASEEMADLLKRRFPWIRGKEMCTVVSPFPLSAHSSAVRDSARGTHARPRLCFTGRSDYLHSGSLKMGKDDLGVFFDSLIQAEMDVFVQAPRDNEHRRLLAGLGYSFYSDVPRSHIMNGGFADMISGFDGHLVYYEVTNSTISRRVSTSLSTRFATAICSSTPLIVPPEATFAVDFLSRNPIGFASRDPHVVRRTLGERGRQMREYWMNNHQGWTGESNASGLRQLLE